MEIDHIGYLTKDIHAAVGALLQLGYVQETEVIRDTVPQAGGARNISLCFLRNGAHRVELVSPIDETSDVYALLKRQGDGPYHICYRTDDLERTLAELKRSAWVVIKPPAPATAFLGRSVAFLFKRGLGMIELLESGEDVTRA